MNQSAARLGVPSERGSGVRRRGGPSARGRSPDAAVPRARRAPPAAHRVAARRQSAAQLGAENKCE